MKTCLTLFTLLLIFSSISSYKKSNLKKMSQIVESDFPDDLVQVKDVFTFGDGTNGGYVIKNENNYISPTTVEDLSKEKLDNYVSEKAEINEKESIKNYYNGETKLNQIRIICRNFSSASGCLAISHCGWCGSSSSCIEGNEIGPVEKCSDKTTYSFHELE